MKLFMLRLLAIIGFGLIVYVQGFLSSVSMWMPLFWFIPFTVIYAMYLKYVIYPLFGFFCDKVIDKNKNM